MNTSDRVTLVPEFCPYLEARHQKVLDSKQVLIQQGRVCFCF